MTNSILLDTSYLLPILGVEIEGIQKVLVKLQQDYNHKKVRLFFNRISLFEALAKISKLEYNETRVQ